MRSSIACSLAFCAPFFLAACDGSVASTTTSGSGGTGGSGGSGGETTSGSTSAGGSGGSGGGAGGATSEECAQLAAITLSDPQVVAIGDDSAWNPGEAASVLVTMTNTGASDINYPGVTITSDQPLVAADMPYNAFFVLFAGESMAIELGVSADVSAPKGTAVHLVAKLTDVQLNVCEELPALAFDAIVE